jgi:crotonobetainyl-CoA:carnitine CoA-transferase CaiB-like acyl-CoA transferase
MADNFTTALNGVSVLDLTEDRGLYASKLLADLGADVIRIEKPEGGKARHTGPFKDDVPGIENSLYNVNFNTNKRSVTLNINTEGGQDILKRLAKRADVLIEDFAPGVMADLRLDYHVLRELNPRLIMASLTGFGPTGPYSHYKAPDIVTFAMGGQMFVSGPSNAAPVVGPCEQSFECSSVFVAFGVVSALIVRMKTGRGQLLETNAQEVISVFNMGMMNYSVSAMVGVRSGSQFGGAPARIYPCKDGYVHIMVIRANHWVSFLEMLGNPDAFMDEAWYEGGFRARNTDLVDTLVTDFTMTRTKDEIAETCQAHGIPCVPVNSHADFVKDHHMHARGYIKEMEHPVLGKYSTLGAPYQLSETPVRVVRPAPLLGQHNREIYFGELDYSEEDMKKFRAQGII